VFLDNFNYSILGRNTQRRIVFVHGMMAFAANWRKIASRLEGDFQCLIYDQRGHGRSMKPESGYTPEDFAEDLYKITNELGWDRFHLVGHSMGGRNTMVFAHKHPEKVITLTIEDVGPDQNPQMLEYYHHMLDVVPTPFPNKESIKEFFDHGFLQKFTPKEPPAILSTFLQANLEEKPNGKYDWKFSKQAIYEMVREGHLKDRWLEVSSFKMPVLLIRGENSHILKKEVFDKMLAINPQITGVTIPDVGHWVHFEKYMEFLAELRGFIDAHPDLH
jgi:esterase